MNKQSTYELERQLLNRGFPLVLIGASAGAITALGRIIPAISSKTYCTFVIVVHLPSGRNSMLVEIFAGKTTLPVHEAHDKQKIERSQIYFAPPGYHLLVESDRTLSLSVDEHVNYSRPSIDVLFETAAQSARSDCVGIVLTGANHDGARGLRKIHDQGGLTIIQDPGEAEATMMPASALAACPDANVLSLNTIASLFAG